MRRFSFFIGLLILVLAFSSCSENPGTTTMKLVLSTDKGAVSRTLLPQDSTVLDVTKYTVSGTGPHGRKFTKNSDVSSVEIEGLATGTWSVTAKGLNRDGTELVTGSVTFELSASSDPVTIVLDTLVGTGSFTMVLDWTLCEVSNPGVTVYLSGPEVNAEETPLPVTLNRDAKTATVSESLASGSYKIRAILKDGQQQVAGLVEALRVSNGSATSGSYTFHLDSEGPSSLTYMNDASGVPLRGSLSVSNDSGVFYDGETYTCTFSFMDPSTVDTENMWIEWYRDGTLVKAHEVKKAGSSYDLEARIGAHRLDVVVYNRNAGSTGSASYTFNVVPNGVTGEMTLLNPDAGSGIGTLDEDAVITPLPGGMFLVVTPNSAKAYICTVSSMALQVVKTYDSGNFEWLGRTKLVISDPEREYVVFTDDYGNTENITCLHFNQGSRTLEVIAGMRFTGQVPAYGIPFTRFTTAAYNTTAGFVYLVDSGTNGYDTFMKESGNTMSAGGMYRKHSNHFTVSDLDISPDGHFAVYGGAGSSKFVSTLISDLGTLTYHVESEDALYPLKFIRFLNNQTVAAVDENGITSYKVVSKNPFTKYKRIEIGVADFVQDSGNYFYVADLGKHLVSYSVSGYEISQLGSTTLESQIRKLCLNEEYLVALTADNRIALFRVIE